MEARGRRPFRRLKHRLPRRAYRGQITATFTACVAERREIFVHEDVVELFRASLQRAADAAGSQILLYCFMPDHLHTVLRGTGPASDLWKTMSLFKQRTGYWLARHRPGVKWQGDFFDHIVRDEDELKRQMRYVVGNPMRRGLVDNWQSYPFLGSDVYDLVTAFPAGEDPA